MFYGLYCSVNHREHFALDNYTDICSELVAPTVISDMMWVTQRGYESYKESGKFTVPVE